MKQLYSNLILLFFLSKAIGQTANTTPLPAGETVIGGHLHVGAGNEVWTDAGDLFFNYRGSAKAIHFWNLGGQSGKSTMTLLNNGNVGIGTTSPLGSLHLNADAPYLYLTSTNATLPNAAIRGIGGTWLFGYQGSVGTEDISIGTQDGTGSRTLTFATGGNAKMKILANGNVGIGTMSPGDYKLNIAGKIRADEIVVNTTGADFVFDSTYNLRTLPELETFIKQNKHLPEIAPAKEMQENGVSAGEMQAKLLQKIEELTLYVIELKKENQELKDQNQVFQKRLDKIETNLND